MMNFSDSLDDLIQELNEINRKRYLLLRSTGLTDAFGFNDQKLFLFTLISAIMITTGLIGFNGLNDKTLFGIYTIVGTVTAIFIIKFIHNSQVFRLNNLNLASDRRLNAIQQEIKDYIAKNKGSYFNVLYNEQPLKSEDISLIENEVTISKHNLSESDSLTIFHATVIGKYTGNVPNVEGIKLEVIWGLTPQSLKQSKTTTDVLTDISKAFTKQPESQLPNKTLNWHC